MRLLALASYPEQAACTRFRIAAYVPALRRARIDVDLDPFLSPELFESFYDPSRRRENAFGVARAIAGRLKTLLRSRRYDAVFVQREAALLGPAVVEETLARGLRLPLIYDVDDAVWLAGKGSSTNATRYPVLSRLLKSPSKSLRLMRIASTVIAGSQQLEAFARQHNPRTEVLPTVVSRQTWTPLAGRLDGAWASEENDPPVVGWIGTHSTAPQLELVAPALLRLRAEGHRFRVRVIGAGADFGIDDLKIERIAWAADREIRDFQEIDIGVAPMFLDEWSEGKCGFKQIQYMAVGVPMVTSVAGGARDFIRHGHNALVAETEDDWYRHLRSLLTERTLRSKLASDGRRLIEERYSLEAQEDRFVEIVRAVTRAR